ncbi:hypothetical protein K431DRAFT_345367 [Polychaeton citri CBS 116435]|uniref:Uncharacterized protein n=1 Tax=Polychaeton citri CBS 116435 TaxID=1314669 RepID=A0A9P4URH6_9PEZI|nr:hypothetical protein K431DRAFT_345367 [Polychaeton citri CBS 116435]
MQYAMKTFATSLLVSLAVAANHSPVTIKNFDSSFDVKCGKTKVAGTDIRNAISWAVNLSNNGETRQGKSADPYPHYYGNGENFEFVSDECNGANNNRNLFPIIKGGYFGEDGKNDEGKFRAVYVYSGGNVDVESHSVAYYCGTIFHNDNVNSFDGCDVKEA